MQMIQNSGRSLWGAVILLAGILFAGCASSDFTRDPLAGTADAGKMGSSTNAPKVVHQVEDKANMLGVGDQITVTFSDVINAIQPVTQTIKDDGTITLIYNQQFQAASNTIGALEKLIHDRYVPNYFVNMTVNVTTAERFYFVGGEVKAPNRQVYTGPIRVTGAIDTAGGFTEYAKKSKIEVTRANGRKFRVNYNDALDDPLKNPEIYPGDRVHVPKKIF